MAGVPAGMWMGRTYCCVRMFRMGEDTVVSQCGGAAKVTRDEAGDGRTVGEHRGTSNEADSKDKHLVLREINGMFT